MKKLPFLALCGLLAATLCHPLAAQPAAPAAGRLTYEATSRIDMSKAQVMGLSSGGQATDLSAAGIQIQGPDGAMLDLPRTRSYHQYLVFRGTQAREEREQAGAQVLMMGGSGAAMPKVAPPYTEQQYLDLTRQTRTTVTTIDGTAYALPTQPAPAPPTDWQDLPQTKKIAGYTCHKATATYQQRPYTLWVTTQLPFTYSPVHELTPTRGVVLALSSDQQQYTATRLAAEPVTDAAVRPAPTAKPIAEAELRELRTQAQAAMQQRIMEQFTNGQR